MRAVVVEARRVDDADAAQEPQRRVARLRQRRRRCAGRARRRRAAVEHGVCASTGAERRSSGSSAGDRRPAPPGARSHWPRQGLRYHVAEPSSDERRPRGRSAPRAARSSSSAPWQRQAMSSQTWTTRARPRLEREERVEGRDAVGVGGRHGQPPADVVERAGADPADPLLQRPERGQQQVPPRAGRVAAVRPCSRRRPRAARRPPSPRRAAPSTASSAARSRGVGSASGTSWRSIRPAAGSPVSAARARARLARSSRRGSRRP